MDDLDCSGTNLGFKRSLRVERWSPLEVPRPSLSGVRLVIFLAASTPATMPGESHSLR